MLQKLISRIWPRKTESSLTEYIELDRTPTPEEEKAGFKNPALLLSPEEINNRDRLQDIDLKLKFANMACKTVRIWVWMLVFVTLFQGMGKIVVPKHDDYDFKLEEWAFIAVFTTTTASVFGLALLVGRYLFPINKQAEK